MSNVRDSHTFREMIESIGIVRNFRDHAGHDAPATTLALHAGEASRGLHIVGEGSSLKFPAGYLRHRNLRNESSAMRISMEAMNGTDGEVANHRGATVALISNSGETDEVMRTAHNLKRVRHISMFAITATPGSSLTRLVGDDRSVILTCGGEKGIAATKSVVEQALVLERACLRPVFAKAAQRQALATNMEQVLLHTTMDPQAVAALAGAKRIHLAGPDNGAGDELSLKMTETGMPTTFYPGTDILHGYEEGVFEDEDVVVLLEPPVRQEERFEEKLVTKAGISVFAIASRPTRFTTMQIPSMGYGLDGYLHLAAGWSALAQVAEAKGLDIDKPRRAKKIGNQYRPDAAPQ